MTVFDCQGGEILAEDIVNDAGVPIIVKNTVINQYIREKLICLGVKKLRIYNSQTQHSEQYERSGFEKFHKDYKRDVLQIKEVVNELSVGKKLDYNKVNSICNSIFSKLRETDCIIKCLSKVKSADEYTYYHSINVAFYSMLLAKWLRIHEAEIKEIVLSGLLHDIGKIKVPIEILNKKRELLPEEFDEIKKHSLYGYFMLKHTCNISENICKATLMHHEREDGSGYPYGLMGEQIDKYAKIVAIADVYDAMTSNRVYKKAVSPFHVFETFYTSGIKIFDINMLMTFIKNLSPYYLDSKVLLNNGAVGEVVYIPPFNVTKPIVSLNGEYIDFSRDCSYQIQSLIGVEDESRCFLIKD